MPKIAFILDDGSRVEQEVNDEVYNLAAQDANYGRMLRDAVIEAHTLNSRIDRTPFKYKAKSPITSRGMVPGGVASTEFIKDEDEEFRRKTLAEGGIAVGHGPFSPAEISYFQGLAKDSPAEFAEFFIPRVKAKVAPRENINPRHLVKVGEDGKVRFLNLQTDDNPAGTNRWTEFEGMGFDPFNGLEFLLDVTGGVAGGQVAKRVGMKPFKEAAAIAAGSGTGASTAELARYALGRAHGIIDKPISEGFADAGKRGALAFVGSEVGYGLGRAYHHLKSTPNPYFFNADTAREFEKSSVLGEKVASDIRSIPGGEDFRPDIAQTSGEQSLLVLRQTLASRGGSTSEMKTSSRLLTNDQSNNRILNNLLNDLLYTENKVTAQRAGEAIKGINLQQILKMPASAQKTELLRLYNENLKASSHLSPIMQAAEEGRSRIISRLRGNREERIGEKAVAKASGLEGTLKKYQDAESKAWGEYERMVKVFEDSRGKPLDININSVFPHLREFMTTADQLWSGTAKKRFTQVLEPLAAAAEKRGGYVSLSELNTNLSAMKETLRIAQREVAQDSPSIAAQQAAISSLQKVRDEYLSGVLKSPQISSALEAAEATTRRVHHLTKRSVARKFLQRDLDDTYKIRHPDEVFKDVMIPGNDEGMRQWLDIVDGDPRILQATKDWYGQHYHNAVMRNGLADPEAHRKWLRDFGPQAKLIFGKDYPSLERLGRISFAIKAGQARLKRLERDVRQSTNGKIDKMDPEKIVNTLIGAKAREGGASAQVSSLSINETHQFLEMLKRESPETVAVIQDRAKEMIRKSIFGDELTAQTSKRANVDTLTKFLEESGEQRLGMVMGHRFVNDLKAVKRGLEIMDRSAKAIPMPQDTPALTLFRVIFGPLSKVQRGITAARKYSVLGQEEKLAEILTDPAKLRKVMESANMPAKSPQAAAILSSLGVLYATQ